MYLTSLPVDWMPTRSALQAYTQAMTALPRAAARPDPRWSHVALDPMRNGFATWPTPLEDGTSLVAMVDLDDHRVRATAGDDIIDIDLRPGPTSVSVGDALLELAARHGAEIAVDRERFGTGESRTYDPEAATAFFAQARGAVEALERVNAELSGETAGPHLWPHGFDIATEWFSGRMVDDGESQSNAQIAMGWYPSTDSYVYVNPWPFRDEYAEIPLPGGARWHLEGWQGAKLELTPGEPVALDTIVELGAAMHLATEASLGT